LKKNSKLLPDDIDGGEDDDGGCDEDIDDT